ncbi:LysE family transporter [Geosporobacter ferrireducens]|uniref:LysE family transporter n=1 Tax=Geosporobacter ferrireducens TaxID=1424294 RepID=UPI0023545800|nr:LysE family transporter [Geosporobacter ferrireducens]
MIFLQGFLLGLTLQLSVGPVFFTVLHKAIKQGFAEALKMTSAVTLVDAFYIGISFTAISALIKIQYLHRIISMLGMFVLIYFGINYIKNANKKSIAAESGNIENSFFYGLKLTALNPLTIIFWSGTFGSLIAGGKLIGMQNIILYAAGCLTATVLFLGSVSFTGQYIKKFVNEKVLRIMDYTVGIVLIAFGIHLFFR